jgi:hypothetical protein
MTHLRSPQRLTVRGIMQIVLLVSLLIGLTSPVAPTSARAQATPTTSNAPAWLEPRGLSVIDLVGQAPEEHLKGAVIVYSGGNGILRYQTGMRTENVVEIKVSITPRYFTFGQDTYTRVNCLGQPAAYDQWPTTVPASSMRLFADGRDITNKIESMSTIPAGQVLPTNNANGFYRYPEPQAAPVSLENGVLPIPANMGCTIISPGKLSNMTAIFTVISPPTIQVTAVGSETFSAHSYIGVGSAGALSSLNTQMQRRFGQRHDKFEIAPPEESEFAFVHFPPTEMDPYAGEEPINRPLPGAEPIALNAPAAVCRSTTSPALACRSSVSGRTPTKPAIPNT